MTPIIHKIAYVHDATSDKYVLMFNNGQKDVSGSEFETEKDLLSYLANTFQKVGAITDYDLYIAK